jgi:hypothetical protein
MLSLRSWQRTAGPAFVENVVNTLEKWSSHVGVEEKHASIG